MKSNRAQNVIEYVLLITAVISVMIIFLRPHGRLERSIEGTLFNGAIIQLQNATNDIKL